MAEYKDVELLRKQMAEFKTAVEQFVKSSSFLMAYISGIDAVMEIIDEAPITDVQEVKHGRWEVSNTELGYNNAEIPIEWECSLCDSAFEDKYLYCPHCGARMDGKEVEK